jgi:hypothetical protein
MSSARSEATDGTGWGENFWITIVDPQVCDTIVRLWNTDLRDLIADLYICRALQTGSQFYACPATGDASWDPPAGHFVFVVVLIP